jgi:exodeoxyribonuclease V beta subunit
LPAVLAAPLSTPQVALPPGFSLQTLRSTDRLDELAFDLRLGAGTRFSRDAHVALADDGTVSLDALFAALRACPDVLPAPWVRSFEQRLRSGRFARGLVGILRGAIDLVLRIEGPRGARYIVADYKTNRLPGDSLASYARSGLLAAMVDGDYLLQALLYTVAVHRELRVRLRDYDYDAHVGGFLYLFVRGMAVARAEGDVEPYGVYADRFPRSLVEAVDHALSARTFP